MPQLHTDEAEHDRSATSEKATLELEPPRYAELLRRGFRVAPRGLDPEEVSGFLEALVGSGQVASDHLRRLLLLRAVSRAAEDSPDEEEHVAGPLETATRQEARCEEALSPVNLDGEASADPSPRAVETAARGDLSRDDVNDDMRPEMDEGTESAVSPLTPRETEILEYVARGHLNKEVARQFGITEQTTKNHVSSILRKLNAGRRTEAVVLAIKRGLVFIA